MLINKKYTINDRILKKNPNPQSPLRLANTFITPCSTNLIFGMFSFEVRSKSYVHLKF